MIDLKNTLDVVSTLAPAARTATTNGTGVDTLNYNGVLVTAELGALTDGTHTPVLQESDDNTTFTDVPAAQMIGAFTAMTANSVQKVGYAGTKRYLRVRLTVTGATTGALSRADFIGGAVRKAPV